MIEGSVPAGAAPNNPPPALLAGAGVAKALPPPPNPPPNAGVEAGAPPKAGVAVAPNIIHVRTISRTPRPLARCLKEREREGKKGKASPRLVKSRVTVLSRRPRPRSYDECGELWWMAEAKEGD